jgi:hypothetical protein
MMKLSKSQNSPFSSNVIENVSILLFPKVKENEKCVNWREKIVNMV